MGKRGVKVGSTVYVSSTICWRELFKEGTTEKAIRSSTRIPEHSTPKEIMTVYGSQFYMVRKGESRLINYCETNSIRHILGGVGKPTTPDKIRSWFRTYDLEHARFHLHREIHRILQLRTTTHKPKL